MTKIYALIDPRNDEVRYIGQTNTDLNKRLIAHISNARSKQRSHKNHWIKQILDLGLKPFIELLDQVDDKIFWEKWYIAYFRGLGVNLTNATEGGEGTIGWKADQSFKDKARLRMLKLQKPKLSLEEAIKIYERLKAGEKLKDIAIEYKINRDTIKRTISNKYSKDYFNGFIFDPINIRKSGHNKGIPMSEEQKKKLRHDGMLGKTHSEESIMKMRLARLGKTFPRNKENQNGIS